MNELSVNYTKAQELDRRIKTSAQLAQQSLYEMCKGFKEMRDSKLYKELGYSTFEDYCEQETGLKKFRCTVTLKLSKSYPKVLFSRLYKLVFRNSIFYLPFLKKNVQK